MELSLNLSDSAASGGKREQGHSASRLSLFFSHAFRPFFLGGGIYAALAMAAWLAWIGIHAIGAIPAAMSVAEPLHLWHAHEMVFGFGAAAAGGFLLTAIPNWTGAQHSRGIGLGIMFALWCAGRIAMWSTALVPVAVPMFLDLAFLPVLAFAAGRQLAVQPALRNVIFFSLILALVCGNALFHLERIGGIEDGMRTGVILGLAALVMMIIIIGGRVVPAFTTNALRRRGVEEHRLPIQRPAVNMASLVLSAAALLALVAGGGDAAVGGLAFLAALANGTRLAGWRGPAILGEPILWVLHLGYLWIVAGFVLLAASRLLGWGGDVSALHAFGTGAVGTMTLAIMSRASLGHTGRALVASRPIVTAYVLVSAGAVLRCFAPLALPQFYNEAMLAAGFAWIIAFVLFSIVFTPVLLGPRVTRSS